MFASSVLLSSCCQDASAPSCPAYHLFTQNTFSLSPLSPPHWLAAEVVWRHLRRVATASTSPLVIACHPREPGIFTGTEDIDVDDWLSLFERVSTHSRWDPTVMLANVIFYLKGESPARKWFGTNNTELGRVQSETGSLVRGATWSPACFGLTKRTSCY